MDNQLTPIPENRRLTEEEFNLGRWMLEQAGPGATEFIEQLKRAHVVAHCPCGCASVDFAVDGSPCPVSNKMQILADFEFGEESQLCGVFLFAKDGILSGLEVCGYAIDAPKKLPAASELRAVHVAR